jgi:aryl-alcohol dehydrogenase-like predicted oxidoreductase
MSGTLLDTAYLREQVAGARQNHSEDNKDKAFDCAEALEPIAQSRGVSGAQAAFAWIPSKQQVSSIIIGARRLEQLKDNLAASKLVLSETELKTLMQRAQLSPEYPGWMLAAQGQYRAKPVKE